ncbi:aldehyde dehydrogenase family protein [Saccharopolyspora mangrovi]|uniref:Aldehyde dehydrogenase family protein n=1 Tax=Saccharopolyspora mangrovi TaxID=3082379 RepID=A0ABU6AF41_9PSEU|nr:aldehyde dehydrogenase family protein [Saccharopolyspora sp. S2-29]MEB3370098.1 aldehyde dehydrogenase family protein [Saccharopolyspora sp. S2-29]
MNTAITTINPATGSEIATYPGHDAEHIEAALTATHAAAAKWAATPLQDRLALLAKLAESLRAHSTEYADLITREMGKPLTESSGEIEKSAVTAEFYVDNAPEILADGPVDIDGARAWIGVRAKRCGLRRHALELSVLAGHALRDPDPRHRERGAAQALPQRHR